MNDDQLLRYSRHILLDEVGYEGQLSLSNAHALVVGAGGLGSPASLYLVASGIGQLTLADPDRVELHNLQRQILHREEDVGRPKATSGASGLQRINSATSVDAVCERLDGDRLKKLVQAADVVLDCSDNFSTRHAVNEACVLAGKPLVSGAAIRFDGQLAIFDLRRRPGSSDSPCYACLFPQDGVTEEVNCTTQGVFGPLTGIIGSLQAAEAAKILMDLPSCSGRLLVFNALRTAWHSITLSRDPPVPRLLSCCPWNEAAGTQGNVGCLTTVRPRFRA